jgi:hypothetical protein
MIWFVIFYNKALRELKSFQILVSPSNRRHFMSLHSVSSVVYFRLQTSAKWYGRQDFWKTCYQSAAAYNTDAFQPEFNLNIKQLLDRIIICLETSNLAKLIRIKADDLIVALIIHSLNIGLVNPPPQCYISIYVHGMISKFYSTWELFVNP